MACASVGLIFILESQYDNGASLLLTQRSFGDIAGGLLAVAGAALAALTICGSLVYGQLLYSRLMEDTRGGIPKEPIEKLDISHQRLMLWLTMMGHLVAKACSLPLLFAVGALDFSGSSDADQRGILGAILLGFILGFGSILLRKGNIDSSNPSTNSLMLLSPLAALFFLSIVGIELPRMELFIVGAALIVAINVLIQAKPDAERDYSRFGKVNLKGARLGFTSFLRVPRRREALQHRKHQPPHASHDTDTHSPSGRRPGPPTGG